eukprot:TRINITY_DN32914_c0_g1_i1.p1 TRINITY_DN32914_c0_g1~~TRINITY_DN32914_c0_g1_i1.p1  ORF type:complete len:1181 (-),score=231.29 TRINITY_DN32914_c0_g1_i1:30-3572(-)
MTPSLTSPHGATQSSFDVVLGEVAEPVLAQVVATCLAKKGFCVVDLQVDKAFTKQVLADANRLREAGRLHQPPELIAEGLLGREGSAKICELYGADVSSAKRAENGESLVAVDDLLTEFTQLVNQGEDILGFTSTHRTPAVLHEAGVPRVAPELCEKDVTTWLDKFLRHKVMAVAFFGPMEGALKLQVYDDDDADVYEVRTSPGTLVLIRPDILSHHHVALGKAVAISCFSIQGTPFSKRHKTGGWIMCPVARELDRWAMCRVQQLKESLKVSSELREDIPPSFQRAMDLCFFQEDVNAVRGLAVKFPGTWEATCFFRSMVAAPDVVGQIPILRWDHNNFYDPSAEGWKRGKTYAKHAAFIDGIELFDARMFGISPMEAAGMDPHMRLTLEAGYEALFAMGQNKKTLMNSSGSVYVGFNSLGDWNFVERIGFESQGPGVTGAGGCIVSNRLSYVMGMKGPSLTVTTDASSALSAVYLGVESMQRKGRGATSDFSVALGVSLMLTPMWWSQHTANGWLSHKGRCFSFDASADGYCRGEGTGAAAMSPYAEKVGGDTIVDSQKPLEAVIYGISLNTNSASASLSAPDGVASQEVIANACHAGGLAPQDVDAVEASAHGSLLADAVEVHALLLAHRSEACPYALSIATSKTLVGQLAEASGMASFLKVVQAAQWAYIAPTGHLREVNPHIDLDDRAGAFISSEGLEYCRRSSLTGVMSQGFGGTNVYAVCWGTLNTNKVSCREPFPANRELLKYWPGGGGALSREHLPSKGYYVVGSWTQWTAPQLMEREANDTYGLTVTLGENGWEQFQIWLDGDPMKVLHPGSICMPQESPVQGPEALANGSWAILGCLPEIELPVKVPDNGDGGAITSSMVPKIATPSVNWSGKVSMTKAPHPESGKPGTLYRIRLHQAGRWRMVDWQKLPGQEAPLAGAPLPADALGRYYVCGSWNSWCTQGMLQDEAARGLFRKEIKLLADGGEFHVLRNRDSFQAFFPETVEATTCKASTEVAGPGPWESGLAWRLQGKAGDVFSIEFRRSQEFDKDDLAISWTHLRHEPLTHEEQLQLLRPTWCVLGSWAGWRDMQPMRWNEDRNCYTYEIQITDVGHERFLFFRDGHPQKAIYPSVEDASMQTSHEIVGPAADTGDKLWAIGVHPSDKVWPGMRYEIRLLVNLQGLPDRVEWNRV